MPSLSSPRLFPWLLYRARVNIDNNLTGIQKDGAKGPTISFHSRPEDAALDAFFGTVLPIHWNTLVQRCIFLSRPGDRYDEDM